MTLNGFNALCFKTHASFGAYHMHLSEVRLTLSAAMTQFLAI